MGSTFYDSQSVPNDAQIQEKYGGQSNKQDLDIYDLERDKEITDQELEDKCIVFLDNLKRIEGHCNLLPEEVENPKWVKATHILVKLMNPEDADNVDASHLWIKGLPL